MCRGSKSRSKSPKARYTDIPPETPMLQLKSSIGTPISSCSCQLSTIDSLGGAASSVLGFRGVSRERYPLNPHSCDINRQYESHLPTGPFATKHYDYLVQYPLRFSMTLKGTAK